MNRKPVALRFIAAAVLMAVGARAGAAQGAPSPPAPPAAPIPPAPAPSLLMPASALPPADSAVALCMNGTWVYAPGTSADCTKRGGLRVAMPPHATPPAVAVAAARAAVMAEPVKAATAPPAGSTMQCKDGTFLSGAPTADRCASNGGLAAIFSRPTPAPIRPSRP